MVDWWALKQQVRRDVHTQFGVPAKYFDADVMSAPVNVFAQFNSEFLQPIGEGIGGVGYAVSLENVDIITLDRDEFATKGLKARKGARLFFDMMPGLAFELDTAMPMDGPINWIWTVVRKQVTT